MRELIDGAIKTLPPPLIDELAVKHPEKVKAFANDTGISLYTRITQHNAYMIKGYLVGGGDTSRILHTPFMPDIDLLMKT